MQIRIVFIYNYVNVRIKRSSAKNMYDIQSEGGANHKFQSHDFIFNGNSFNQFAKQLRIFLLNEKFLHNRKFDEVKIEAPTELGGSFILQRNVLPAPKFENLKFIEHIIKDKLLRKRFDIRKNKMK